MSNCETIELPKLVIPDVSYVSVVLRPILHTIIFTRSLQCCNAQDTFDAALGFAYPLVADAEMVNVIQQRLTEFGIWLQRHEAESGAVKVALHDRPVKKSSIFGEERVQSCWEQWIITITILQPPGSLTKKQFQSQVRSIINFILEKVVSVSYPLPLADASQAETIKISILSDNSAGRALEKIKKAIMDVNTPSILR